MKQQIHEAQLIGMLWQAAAGVVDLCRQNGIWLCQYAVPVSSSTPLGWLSH